MAITAELNAAIEAARAQMRAAVDLSFDMLLENIAPSVATPAGTRVFKEPSDEDCRDPRIKNGFNLTPEGLEVLFRLLDRGAGYNSAGRKMSITQTAVKNRKKDWEATGGLNRTKLFIPWLDRIA